MFNNTVNRGNAICSELHSNPFVLVIFGASGDLTKSKLIPSLFALYKKGILSKRFKIIGCARHNYDDASFRKHLKSSIRGDSKIKNKFIERIFYRRGGYDSAELYEGLRRDLERTKISNRVFYFATPSDLFNVISRGLKSASIMGRSNLSSRVVIEKPYGSSLSSARRLDRELKKNLTEKQIYRIDHYLGKETVQNILMFRFANSIFEPIWNSRFIDHVQITASETDGVGHRAGYYDRAGLLRDMFQNHMMQLISLVAMEPPRSIDPEDVRSSKARLISSILPFNMKNIDRNIIRAQYKSGTVGGKKCVGYRSERGVDLKSMTETFVAGRFFIENKRWSGVPFYLKSGKRLDKKSTEIAVIFKRDLRSIFNKLIPRGEFANALIFKIQPNEGLSLYIQAKSPGAKLCMTNLYMSFKYEEIFGVKLPSPYERLLLDVINSDQTLFLRSDEIESSWRIFTPILERWEKIGNKGRLFFYSAGSSGPEGALRLMERDKRRWCFEGGIL